MVGTSRSGRRTVLQMLVSCVAALAGVESASAVQGDSPGTDTATVDGRTAPMSVGSDGHAHSKDSLTGFYEATVDRIVDGNHVVILLEDGDKVVAEYVRPRSQLQSVSEGTRLLVFVFDGDLTVLWEL